MQDLTNKYKHYPKTYVEILSLSWWLLGHLIWIYAANSAESGQWLRYPNNSVDLGGAILSSFEYLLKYTVLGGLGDIVYPKTKKVHHFVDLWIEVRCDGQSQERIALSLVLTIRMIDNKAHGTSSV